MASPIPADGEADFKIAVVHHTRGVREDRYATLRNGETVTGVRRVHQRITKSKSTSIQ